MCFERSPKTIYRLLLLFIAALSSHPAWAIGPMSGFHDLVAGEGAPGLSDGPFYSALFNNPQGLAINPEGTQLYVADTQNHCIRIIDLEHSNRVSTLAGNGSPDYVDGPFSKAAFDKPSGLVFIGKDRLAVDDEGNNRIRLIDLGLKTVSTLMGTSAPGLGDGESSKAQAGLIWNMAYVPGLDTLYFTQPEFGTLRAIQLKTRQVSTVFRANPEMPRPAALCGGDKTLYVAGQYQDSVYEMSFPEASSSTVNAAYSWKIFTQGKHLLSMAWSGKSLYGVQCDPNASLARLAPNYEPMTFVSIWGEILKEPGHDGYFSNCTAYLPAGLVADPLSEKKFYLSHPRFNFITSFRALGQQSISQGEVINADGLKDFDYPIRKPSRTFRILLIGDSHTSYVSNDESTMFKGFADDTLKLHFRDLPKQMEMELNASAALDDVPQRFEVLQYWRNAGEREDIWPYYVVPDLARKFDVDLVLFMLHPSVDFNSYFERPMTGQDIPDLKIDPEFLLRPAKERLGKGLGKKFFELCQAKKLVTLPDPQHFHFAPVTELSKDPEILDCMAQLYSRPTKLMVEKLKGIKTSGGAPVRTEILFTPLPRFDLNPMDQKPLWDKVLQDIQAPSIDLSPEIAAYRVSFFPMSESEGNYHFNSDSNALISYWIIHELIKEKAIPYAPESGADAFPK